MEGKPLPEKTKPAPPDAAYRNRFPAWNRSRLRGRNFVLLPDSAKDRQNGGSDRSNLKGAFGRPFFCGCRRFLHAVSMQQPQKAYNGAMAKKSAPIEVVCPCCQSKLVIDAQLATVLSHTTPPKAAPDVDISDSARILAEQARRREDKFRESWEAESKKEDVLARKFEEGAQEGPRGSGRKASARFRS